MRLYNALWMIQSSWWLRPSRFNVYSNYSMRRDSAIIVTRDSSEHGDIATFSDLAIAVTAHGNQYKTYRKPFCMCAHLSSHSSMC